PKDDKFIPAFYSALQNTLVAENLQQVTLNGEFIDKYGTMSGVNDQVLKAFDITSETIAKLEREHSHLEFNEKLSLLESQLQEKKNELPKLEDS
ncbi:17368_t:CDS:2, partial [Funneliformis geosporum]